MYDMHYEPWLGTSLAMRMIGTNTEVDPSSDTEERSLKKKKKDKEQEPGLALLM